MSFGTYNQTKINPTTHRFRSISNIQGARSVKDLACRVQLAMDNLNSQLNSNVMPALANITISTPSTFTYKEVKMEAGSVRTYGSRHDSQAQKMTNWNWFVAAEGGHEIMVQYTTGLNEYLAYFHFANEFGFGAGETSVNYDIGRYFDLGATTSAGTFGWRSPNGRYVLDIYASGVRVYEWGRDSGTLISSASSGGLAPANGIVYLPDEQVLFIPIGTNKQCARFQFDESNGQIATLDNFTWTTNDQIRSISYDKKRSFMVLFTNSSRIRTYDASDPYALVELDEAVLSTDSASLASGDTVRGAVDCDDGLYAYFLIPNAGGTARMAGAYAIADDGTLTITTNQVQAQSTAATGYTGEGFWVSDRLFRFLSDPENANAAVNTIDFTDPDNPVVQQNYALPIDGGAGFKYQFPRFDALLQFDRQEDGLAYIRGLKDTTDTSSLKTFTLDQLKFNERGCLDWMIAPNNNMVPNLNAQYLQGYGAGDFLKKTNAPAEVWLWETH